MGKCGNEIIKELVRLYNKYKYAIKEEECGLNIHTANYIDVCERFCSHIDHAIDIIDEPYKTVLVNDFYKGTFGKSIKIDVSTSTYYRNANKAHDMLIDILDCDK